MQTATLRALAALSALHGGASDYRLARLLGISQQRISMYRCGRRQFDEALPVRAAELCGIPPEQLLAEIQAERATEPTARAAWLRLADMARAASVGLVILASGAIGLRAPDRPTLHGFEQPTTRPALNIMLSPQGLALALMRPFLALLRGPVMT